MDVRKAVTDLLPTVAKLADDAEADRRLPDELVDGLRAAGCLRMLVPKTYGGLDLPLPEVLGVIEELATADGSTAWSVGQVALSQLIIACAPRETVDLVCAGGPDVYAAGAVAPKGRASVGDDGWSVSGRWPFVTGCLHASWLYLNCVVVRDRSVQMAKSGTPQTRIVILPASAAQIEDTWYVLGLRGTGSHDVSVIRSACPAQQGVELVQGTPQAARAVNRIAQSSLIIASVAVGIASAALDDVVSLAVGGKRPALSPTRLAASPELHSRLGEAHTVLRAAKALLHDESERAWRRGDGDTTARHRAHTRAAATHVTALATSVVDTAYSLGGGTSVYDLSPLQRRLRDIHTASQHFVAGRQAYTSAGALLAGAQPDTGMF